jgi:hypothetical protein
VSVSLASSQRLRSAKKATELRALSSSTSMRLIDEQHRYTAEVMFVDRMHPFTAADFTAGRFLDTVNVVTMDTSA